MAEARPRKEDPEQWMTIDEAAVTARISSGTVYRKIREGVLPGFRKIGKTMVRRSDVRKMIEPVPITPSAAPRRRRPRASS